MSRPTHEPTHELTHEPTHEGCPRATLGPPQLRLPGFAVFRGAGQHEYVGGGGGGGGTEARKAEDSSHTQRGGRKDAARPAQARKVKVTLSIIRDMGHDIY